MAKSKSNRILSTPSNYARKHYLYVQEVGSLESIEPHVSTRKNLNSYLFFVVVTGSGTLTYENQIHTLSTGSCVWIDCNKQYAHESSTSDPWTLMWVHFNGMEAPSYYHFFLEQEHSFLFKPHNVSIFTLALTDLYQVQKEQTSLTELCSHKYITDIITACFKERIHDFSTDSAIPDKIQQIRTYIELHFKEKISLDELSEHFYISKFHLSREYKKAYGITIGNTLMNERISYAKSQLRFTNDSVETISLTCGFLDSAYFIKVFKSAEGMTPLEYRKKW